MEVKILQELIQIENSVRLIGYGLIVISLFYGLRVSSLVYSEFQTAYRKMWRDKAYDSLLWALNLQAAQGQSSDIFTCPMHPQIKLPQLGDCPICGMSLVKRQRSRLAYGSPKQPGVLRHAPTRRDAQAPTPGLPTVIHLGALALPYSRRQWSACPA